MHGIPARVVAIALALAGLVAFPARADLVIQPNLPDFYQHQKSGPAVNVPGENLDFSKAAPRPDPSHVPSYDLTPNWWESGGGWCCIAAYVNSLYYLEKTFDFPGLFTRPGGDAHTWQEQMIYAIEDMASQVFGLGVPMITIPQYIMQLAAQAAAENDLGPHKKLSYSQFALGGGGTVFESDANRMGDLTPYRNVSGQFSSLFDVYRQELCKGQDVEMFWQFPGGVVPPGETAPWWAGPNPGNYHTTTGAGVDCNDPTDMTVLFADPDKRNDNNGNMYLNSDVRTPYPDDNTLPVPVGEMHYEEVELNAGGCITSGIYTGACLVQVTDISVTPEPPAALVILASLVGLVRCRRRR
jgi:hypothetical protein